MVEAELEARRLRARAWRRKGRWGICLPVDPFEIAMDMGLKVLVGQDVSSEVAGTLRKDPGYSDPEILLNGDDSRSRQRFTCAHELGHYTLQVESDDRGVWEFLDGRDLLGSVDPDEVWANHFAAELLMPQEIVRDQMADTNVAALAVDFGVSTDAMLFRLDTMGAD